MNFKNVLISELKPAAYNPRKNLSDKDPEYQRIKKSIETFGYVDPIIVNSDYTVIGGHQRLKVLKEMGEASIDVVVVDLPKNQEKALNVALNKISGDWDFSQLSIVLSELKEADFDISITGFSEDELKKIDEDLFGKKVTLDTEPQISRAEELRKEWGTETGQLWQCGEHRVICGDCTDPAVVERVMQGEKADMAFTDPPYGIGKPIANDDLSEAELTEFNKQWVSIASDHIKKDCHFVCFHSPRLFHTVLNNAMALGWNFQRMMTLYKPNDCTFPWQGFILKSESILLFIKGDPEYLKVDPFLHDTLVYNNGGFKEDVSHPTAKLKQMIWDLMARFGGEVVLDPFLGSGTTMIACENLGRKCRGCEISPEYVAVILQRYKDTFPDKEIRLIQDGGK
ncbi:MAG: DNA methyltransferase [Methanoregula sp.]|nr:DNA methyltransferase [Methanoregula sp.]